jgi:hypothetical protein
VTGIFRQSVASEGNNNPQPRAPLARTGSQCRPFESAVSANVCVSPVAGKLGVATQHWRLFAELETDGTAERDILIDRMRQHGDTSMLGHGCAMRCKVVRSTFA